MQGYESAATDNGYASSNVNFIPPVKTNEADFNTERGLLETDEKPKMTNPLVPGMITLLN
jgi:hypothetical protein